MIVFTDKPTIYLNTYLQIFHSTATKQ